MYLWRKRATPQWWIDNEAALRARFGNAIAVVERPNRARIEIEIACDSPNELRKFGGRAQTAIRVAKENARRNKIDNVRFKVADVCKLKLPRKIDIVVANLFSELLIEVLPKIQSPRWVILSGILREQERGVTRALRRCKIDIIDVRRRGKWVAILARKLRRP